MREMIMYDVQTTEYHTLQTVRSIYVSYDVLRKVDYVLLKILVLLRYSKHPPGRL